MPLTKVYVIELSWKQNRFLKSTSIHAQARSQPASRGGEGEQSKNWETSHLGTQRSFQAVSCKIASKIVGDW